jgi:hypothetical protein
MSLVSAIPHNESETHWQSFAIAEGEPHEDHNHFAQRRLALADGFFGAKRR